VSNLRDPLLASWLKPSASVPASECLRESEYGRGTIVNELDLIDASPLVNDDEHKMPQAGGISAGSSVIPISKPSI